MVPVSQTNAQLNGSLQNRLDYRVMQYFTTTSAASGRAAGCVVVGIYQRGKLSKAATDIDKASGGHLRKLIRQGDISAAPGKCTVLSAIAGVRARRVAVVGLGKFGEFGVTRYRKALTAAVNVIKGTKSGDILNYLSLESIANCTPYYAARYFAETAGHALYTYDATKSKPVSQHKIRRLGQAIPTRAEAADANLGMHHADGIVSGASLCRELGNLPANVCTPSYLAQTARDMAKTAPAARNKGSKRRRHEALKDVFAVIGNRRRSGTCQIDRHEL